MKIIVLVTCVVLILSACGPSPEQIAVMTETALTATAAAWTPTPTLTNTPTHTPTALPTDTPTPTLAPTITNTPAPTLDPNRYYAMDDSFSIITPMGWVDQDFGLKYMGLIGPQIGAGVASMIFVTESTDFDLSSYSATFQEVMKSTAPDLLALSEEAFVTPEGLEFLRLAIEYTLNEAVVHQVVYLFDEGDTIYTIIYSREGVPETDAINFNGQTFLVSEYDALIDEIVNTFQFEQ